MTQCNFDIAVYLRPGDTVLIGQATAEPPVLVEHFIEAAQRIDDLTALCGYTLSDAWAGVGPGRPHITAYAAHGVFRKLASQGLVNMAPWHYSRIESLITRGLLPVDVVLLQVAPLDDEGYYPLGATVDYAHAAAATARVVLVEVNETMPRTTTNRRLHQSQVTSAIHRTKQLAGSPARLASDVELRVAANVAGLIDSGATVQLGAGALADAIAHELRARRQLRIRSGLVGDWLADLDEDGALDRNPGSVSIGIALGEERLYQFLRDSPWVQFAPLADLVDPAVIAKCDQFVSVNSAIEVDVMGQVNAEVVNDRYVGAVGGQVDFFRATRASKGGLAVLALSATTPSGASRIVGSLAGPVTTSKSDVDMVVTEWGIADLRAATMPQIFERLIAVADPRHRADLQSYRPSWV